MHAVEALKIPGVVSCRRYKLAANQMMPPGLPEFLAVYQVDHEVMESLPGELASRSAAGEISMHELMASGTVAFYEQVSEPTL